LTASSMLSDSSEVNWLSFCPQWATPHRALQAEINLVQPRLHSQCPLLLPNIIVECMHTGL